MQPIIWHEFNEPIAVHTNDKSAKPKGWYHYAGWDEDWFGPFATKQQAQTAFDEYLKNA